MHGFPRAHLRQLLCAESFFLVVTVPWAKTRDRRTQCWTAVGTGRMRSCPPGSAGSCSGTWPGGICECLGRAWCSVVAFHITSVLPSPHGQQCSPPSTASAGSQHHSHQTCDVPKVSCWPLLDVTDFPLLGVGFALSSLSELLWIGLSVLF